jgi:hypothetical protein
MFPPSWTVAVVKNFQTLAQHHLVEGPIVRVQRNEQAVTHTTAQCGLDGLADPKQQCHGGDLGVCVRPTAHQRYGWSNRAITLGNTRTNVTELWQYRRRRRSIAATMIRLFLAGGGACMPNCASVQDGMVVNQNGTRGSRPAPRTPLRSHAIWQTPLRSTRLGQRGRTTDKAR